MLNVGFFWQNKL